MVTSPFHTNTLTITTSKLAFKATCELQQIFLFRAFWVSLKGPVVLSQNIRGLACLRFGRHITSSKGERPLVKRFLELDTSAKAVYKEKIVRIRRSLSGNVSKTQVLWSTNTPKSWVGTERSKSEVQIQSRLNEHQMFFAWKKILL